jgi:prepilin-type processing-associated H-X9-DG protein
VSQWQLGFGDPGIVNPPPIVQIDTGPGWGWASFILPQMEQLPLYDSINFIDQVWWPENETSRMVPMSMFTCPSDGAAPTWTAYHQFLFQINSPTIPICDLAASNYVGMYGISEPGAEGEGVFFRNSAIDMRNITDGLSQTIAVGERSYLLGGSTWTGAVTGATLLPPPNGVGRFRPEHSAGMVLGHAGEGRTPGDAQGDTNQFYSRHGKGVLFLFVDGHVSFLKSTMNYKAYAALATRAGNEVISSDY